LLELSLVPVPANQEALRRAVEKGFDADFIKTVEAKMEVIDKGAVADELSAEEMAEAKYQNWCKVMDVIQAFGYVYFDQETPVDSFQTLLTETVDLLQQVADGEGTETTTKIGKAIGSAEAKDFTAREEKAGAKLSKNSLAIIGKAMEAMGEGCTHLKSLVDSCAKDEDTQDKSAEEVAEVAVVEEVAPVKPTEAVQDTGSVEADTVVVLSLADVMENVQVMLRANDKTNEAVLSMVNKFVANKKAQAVA
jgi:hypothetical protein